jgi:hypothetical protein
MSCYRDDPAFQAAINDAQVEVATWRDAYARLQAQYTWRATFARIWESWWGLSLALPVALGLALLPYTCVRAHDARVHAAEAWAKQHGLEIVQCDGWDDSGAFHCYLAPPDGAWIRRVLCERSCAFVGEPAAAQEQAK